MGVVNIMPKYGSSQFRYFGRQGRTQGREEGGGEGIIPIVVFLVGKGSRKKGPSVVTARPFSKVSS